MTLYASNEGVKAERGHTESERVLSTAVSFYASNCCRFMIQVTHHPPPPAAAASPNDGMRTLFVHLCVVPSPPRRVAPGFTRPACVESLYRARLSISQLSAPARGNESSMRSLQETDFGTIPMPHEKRACDALQRGGRLRVGTACRWWEALCTFQPLPNTCATHSSGVPIPFARVPAFCEFRVHAFQVSELYPTGFQWQLSSIFSD